MRPWVVQYLIIVSCLGCVNETEDDGGKKLGENMDSNGAEIIVPLQNDEVVVMEKAGIKLVEVKSEDTTNASLLLKTEKFNEGPNNLNFSAEGKASFSISCVTNNYGISNYDATSFVVDFLGGNNVFLAFLMDKKGVSVKKKSAYVIKNIVLGQNESVFNMTDPHLFYCSPQGVVANEAVLDFYLLNTAISEKGNKVKVTINGTEFVLTKWAAYRIFGLKQRENSIRIQLINGQGEVISGPFNDSGDRFFLLGGSVN